MPKRGSAKVRCVVLLLAAFGLSANAAPDRVMLRGNVPAAVVRLVPKGRLPATNHLSLTIGLPLRNEAALDELLQQLYNPQSTNFHRFLTPQEFTARFGPTEADYAAVMGFAEANSLTVAKQHPNRLVLDLEGGTSKVEQALQVTFHVYRHPTEARDFFAPGTEPLLPANLRVTSIEGLSDYSLPRRANARVKAPRVRPLSFSGSGPSGEFAGNDFRNAYVPGTALNGAGQTVAVLEYSDYYKVDITNYENYVGASIGATNYVPLNNVVVGGTTPSTSANDEVALDIEMAIAMAPRLSRVMVYEKSSVSSSLLNKIATDNLAKQVSSSWMVGNWSSSTATNYDNILKTMATQGQSYFQSSGDSDAYTGAQPLDNGITIPADSPYATVVGGTTLSMNGGGASWSSETVWNYNLTGTPNEGSGGGISAYYSIPSWQTNISMANNQGSTTRRNIPDVALTADNIYVSYNNGDASGTYYFMGTSAAAPLWAGFCALANQLSLATNGTTLGFLNPTLYNIAGSSCYLDSFHDITTGNNIGTNTAGMFYAVAGYDLATGLGAPKGTNLINALVWPPPMFTNQPVSKAVTNGSSVTFSATASSTTPRAYFWLFNGANLIANGNVSGVTTNTLSIAAATTTNAGSYQLVASNFTGFVTSSVATLTVLLPPAITTNIATQTTECGGNASYTVGASGTAPLRYQWRTNGVSIAGATNASLTLTNVHLSLTVAVVVTNLYGGITNSAPLTVQDTTPPVITLNGANPLTNECHAAFADPGATASDTCAGNLAVSTNSTVNPNGVGVYAIKYSATDSSGNAATNTRTVYIVDKTPPVITLNGANPLTNECHTAFADPGATASDTCAGNLAVSTNSTVNPNGVGVYAIKYSATDSSGNAATNTRTVYIVDKTPPVITLNGANPLTNECHTAFADPGATASDTCAGSVAVTTNSAVNPNGVGVYAIKYSATDSSGNAATNTRTVYIVDKTPPVITLNGANPLTNECHTAFADPGATASDACAGSLAVTTNSTVNPNVPGVYTIQYVVADPSGNAATNTRAVHVVDTTPPVITLNGASPLTNEWYQAFEDPGATASDACDGSVEVTTNGTVNPNTLGLYTIQYRATDPSGNTATNTRTVYVVDTTPPAVQWSFTNLVLASETNCTAPMPDVTGTNYILATDLSGALTISQTPANTAALPLGTNAVIITVEDASGNTAYSTNTIVVQEQTLPQIPSPPQSRTNFTGTAVNFSASATACTPLAYQWLFNDAPITDGTNSTLTLSNLTVAAAGNYSLVATAGGGSATSAVATLTVLLWPSAVALDSSVNPSGCQDDLRFTAFVTPTNATGTIQFFTNGAAFDLQILVAGHAVSTNLASLPRGTNLIEAVYSGDANDLPSTNSLAQIVTNHPPATVPAYYSRAAGDPLNILVSDLATNWTDVDGDSLSLVDCSVSTNGVTLTNDAGTLVYINPNDVADQFTCTISDGFGGANTQTVSITVVLPVSVTPNITGMAAHSDGSFTLSLSGAPGYTYVLEATPDFIPFGNWQPVATNMLDASGAWQFTDSQATNFTQRFYRLRLAQ